MLPTIQIGESRNRRRCSADVGVHPPTARCGGSTRGNLPLASPEPGNTIHTMRIPRKILFLLAILAAFVAYRLFKKGAPPTPDLAIEEAKLIREQFESQGVERDQLERSKG